MNILCPVLITGYVIIKNIIIKNITILLKVLENIKYFKWCIFNGVVTNEYLPERNCTGHIDFLNNHYFRDQKVIYTLSQQRNTRIG